MKDSRETFVDWLTIHKIDFNELKKLVSRFPPQNQIFNKEINDYKTGISAEEAWAFSAKSIAILLPQYKQTIDTVCTEADKCLLPKENKSNKPYALDQGRNLLPFVSCNYMGGIPDLISVAHEFSHAVQIVLSREHQTGKNAFMLPLLRESCAFLGEIALLDFFEKYDNKIHKQLKKAWLNDNIKYLSADVSELRHAIEDNKLEYSYNWNYPVARLYALMLRRQLNIPNKSYGNNDIAKLFTSGAKAQAAICINKLLEYWPIPNLLPVMNFSKEKRLTKYQILGAVSILFAKQNKEMYQYTVGDFYQNILEHLDKKTLFIYFQHKKPVGYACWNTVSKGKIVITELYTPFIDKNRFRKFMEEYYQMKVEVPFHSE